MIAERDLWPARRTVVGRAGNESLGEPPSSDFSRSP
jgi:hypothetical protein